MTSSSGAPETPGTPPASGPRSLNAGQPNTPQSARGSVASTPVRGIMTTPTTPRRRGIQSSPMSPTQSPSQRMHRLRISAGSPCFQNPKLGTPDRFIPSLTSTTSFRMGASAAELSPDERVLRRHIAGSPQRERSTSPVGSRGRSGGEARGGMLSRRMTVGGLGLYSVAIPGGLAPETPIPPRQRGREINGNIFSNKTSPEEEKKCHELRLSAALGVDRARKVLTFTGEREHGVGPIVRRGTMPGSPGAVPNPCNTLWESVLERQNIASNPATARKLLMRTVPTTPFRVLDAPGLRDDYYCSLIAYSPATHSLAVGLHSDVYSWEESTGAHSFEQWSTAHVTSLAFSSKQGQNNILAIGRINGSLTLWTLGERGPRIEQAHNASIACLAWKPVISPQSTISPIGNYPHGMGYAEDLLVGDELGNICLYTVNWGISRQDATITLLRRVVVHTQQICGLAWSLDGNQFATGGNDNTAFLFDTVQIEGPRNPNGVREIPEQQVLQGGEKYRWQHGAAVKAIAFCPWQKSLLATGGGSNDRCIHFFHTGSGVSLKSINVSAQVTSLLWSTAHTEIAATLGYANPDHPVRIVVYSWPTCNQVVQVPWQEDMRALYAVSYPGGPNVSEGSTSAQGSPGQDESDTDDDIRLLRELGTRPGLRRKRKVTEGCIVVAASDETVRFHEVWGETDGEVYQYRGVLGGSDILEQMEGIESDGSETIR